VVFAFGRAEINKFVDIVRNASFAHDGEANDGSARGADGETIRTNVTIQMIRSLTAAAAVHILDHHRWIAGNMLFQEGQHSFNAQITGPSWSRGRDQRDRFAGVKISLRM
jgi:hypothetical protein